MVQTAQQYRTEHDIQECREELRRILESKTFSKSHRLATLLEYIFERSVDGDSDELTEQQIGIHFFHRSPGYNAGEDTIVRGTARHLRKRLEQYYETEGSSSLLRISIPKGAYVAHFEQVSNVADVAPSQPISLPDDEPSPSPSPPKSSRWGFAIAAAAVLILGVFLGIFVQGRLRPSYPVRGPMVLWRTLFSPNTKTILVPGDAALNMYTDVEHRDVMLREYTLQSYQNDTSFAPMPVAGRNPISLMAVTPMADLQLVSELVRVPYTMKLPIENAEVRYARELSFSDVHGNNLVLIGTNALDPWISFYESTQDFRIHRDFSDYTFIVDNKRPAAGEKSSYSWNAAKSLKDAITLVALTDNTQGGGKVLLIQGTTIVSTYGALNFLFDEELWKPVISRATQGGRLHNFEVLLNSDLIRGGVSNTRVVAVHVH